MSQKVTLIKNARIVNEGQIINGDILIEGEIIKEIAPSISAKSPEVQCLMQKTTLLYLVL